RAIGQPRGQAGPLLVFVQRAVGNVGAGLGHHINEAAGAASEFGRRAIGHYLEFLDGVKTHRERRTLAAALLAEEWIVLARVIDRDIIVDALLPVDRDLVAIGTLNDGHTRGKRHQAEEVAAVVA